VVIIDNSINEINFNQFRDVEVISLGANFGIASAQNIGIQFALDNGADIFIFFDQDSEIGNGFIEKLIAPMDLISPMVTTPVFYDKYTGYRFPSFKLSKYGFISKVYNENTNFNIDLMISSGSATNRLTIDMVGLMNEDYFIDFVDIEWGLRCRAQNIPIIVVSDAKMLHSIGDNSIDLKFIRLFIHSPIRTYYKIRNSFLFFSNFNVPFVLGLKEIISAIVHNFLLTFFVDNKKAHVFICLKAIKDGILGVKGKKI
jgi:rhamnosyltransferase